MSSTTASSDFGFPEDGPGSISWFRSKAAAWLWKLGDDLRTVYDDAGVIARCQRQADAALILSACQDGVQPRVGNAPATDAPSPPIWARDALADGVGPELHLRDGRDEPIITLFTEHPRSAYNEDFILVSRNAQNG